MSRNQDPINKDFLGTGRRKTAVARVRLRPGSGKIVINDREFLDYFPIEGQQIDVLLPLKATESLNRFDVDAQVEGGGPTGQAGAIKLGIARALKAASTEFEPSLRQGSLLTRDAREVERKKYGHRKARRSFQFSKR